MPNLSLAGPAGTSQAPASAGDIPVKALPGPGVPVAANSLIYQDGVLLDSGRPDFTRDVKVVSAGPDTQRLTNYPDGYLIEMPSGTELDFRYSPAYVRAHSPELDVKISRERSPYEDVEMYLRDYPNRFIAREDYRFYRQANGIDLIDDAWQTINGRRTRIISFRRTPAANSPETQNEYLFAYILNEQQEFYTFFFRTDSLEAQRTTIFDMLASFALARPEGTARFHLDLHPVTGKWNAETRAFYDQLVGGKRFQWGIFYPWALTKPEEYRRVAAMEQELGFNFPILLHYLYVGNDFPTDSMQRAFDRGQLVELTMQVAAWNNENADIRNASFDLLDGRLDEAVRKFARDARAFRHPFLFRLNNEMNTDWSQYSGVRTLSDVDIYIKTWQLIYRIFEEEGVDNAIWIFNPNRQSYPPMNWNHQVCYYPGNDYVHVIGLTGYNTGDYFQAVTGERWTSFGQIYDPLVSEYRELYSRFPWMITEFASSSVGGDKEQWIREVFGALPYYPEIKAAVWWSYADFDYRPGKEGIPARRYWLDEKDQYLKAFRNGLRKQGLIR
jgi:hypothetical protein